MPKWEQILYPILFSVRLGRTYNRLKCWLGIYHQYQPGFCGWCGKPHIRHPRAMP